jgi:glutamine amidotransferase
VDVAIVDYGVGNLLSVRRALEHCGGRVTLAHEPAQIDRAPRLVLPGVGAFGAAMSGLAARGLTDPIVRFAESGRPLFGICLGMQLLLEASQEQGHHRGLGLVAGRAVHISTLPDGAALRVPHIGWNRLRPSGAWAGTVLDGIPAGAYAYFVHSYVASVDDALRVADTDDDGVRLPAVIQQGNVVGCQFHPEKSAETGLSILANFLRGAATGGA